MPRMTDTFERFHAWSHLVLFLMLFMIALAVMRFGAPTGLVANNESITAQGVGDLKPFLTAVGLLMGLFIAVVIAFNAPIGRQPHRQEKTQAVSEEPKKFTDLDEINKQLAEIRKRLGRN
jgi:hypothetical protein